MIKLIVVRLVFGTK